MHGQPLYNWCHQVITRANVNPDLLLYGVNGPQLVNWACAFHVEKHVFLVWYFIWICKGKIMLQHECCFTSANLNGLTDQQDMFSLIMYLLSICATTSWKIFLNNKFRAESLPRNPTGNSRCHVLASHVLNRSRSFGQSAWLYYRF